MDDRSYLREGGDIFATDMEQPEQVSKIARIFENSTVFITGGTGFIGKMFLEKLLRISKTVKIFLLVRPKKNIDANKRFQDIFEGPNMVPMKLANPKFSQQVRLVNGDCAEKNLGLSEEDKQMLIKEANYIIHCAATVRFDEKLKTAAHINVRAVKDLIAMAKRMMDLKAFLHVSTAFSHCPRKVIDEEFYEAGMKGDDLLQLVEMMDDDKLAAITPALIKYWPNTYVFTKAIAENLFKSDAYNLPIAILRPSIVISSQTEPLAGWIDNYYGVTGIFIAGFMGLLRVLKVCKGYNAEIIPADFVTNAGFAILWDLSGKRSSNNNMKLNGDKDEQISIYNAVSSSENPITWGHSQRMLHKEGLKNPSKMQLWYPMFIQLSDPHLFAILHLLLHTIPAYLVDGICFCLGKEQRLVKGYQKVSKFATVISYFTLREWKFSNQNLQALWQKLEPEDQSMFPFSMKNFSWRNFMYFYAKGMRVYLLKDPLETIPAGRNKMKKLIIPHYTLLTVLAVLISTVFYYLFKYFLYYIAEFIL